MINTAQTTQGTDEWVEIGVSDLIERLKEPKRKEFAGLLTDLTDVEIAKYIRQEFGIPEEATKISVSVLGKTPLAIYSRNGDGSDRYITMRTIPPQLYQQMVNSVKNRG